MSGQNDKGGAKPQSAEASTSRLEWIAAAVGGLLIGAAILYMVYYGLSHPAGPPQFTLQRLSVQPHAEGHLVRFRVNNVGRRTAAGVLVGGELREGGTKVEESETTFQYVPQQSSREGGLLFTRDPARYELQLRVKGYTRP